MPVPGISIVVAVYNDWIALDSCLHSIAQQGHGPGLEVVVVDDGSSELAPEKIHQWKNALPLTIVRQPHAGTSAARNCGIQYSTGSTLLFVDADCRLQANCLGALESAITTNPQHNYFQLRLIGDCSRFIGRTEHLRLTTIQDHTLQANGCMRYLNTAGFSIRRTSVPMGGRLFDTAALRGEDTLLLTSLIHLGQLPFFVAGAVIQHDVPLSVLQCLRKDMRSAFIEGRTFLLIAATGIRIRMSNRERLTMLRSMWKASRQPSIGRAACFVLALRQLLSRITSLAYRLLRGRSDLHDATSSLETRL